MIDQFQIVLFLREQPQSASELLARAFPKAELEEFRKLPNQGSFGLVQVDGFTASIQCQLNRVDLVIDRPAEEGDASSPFIEDHDLPAAFAVAAPALKELTTTLAVVRGAVILTKSVATPDAAAAISDVLANVPGLPYPDGAAEVDYRINVPVRSAIEENLFYNRTARWFSARRGIMAVVPGHNVSAESLSDVSIISVDVNVKAEHSLEDVDRAACFQEMYTLASDVLERGMDSFK